jgi:broad specificity phosphatase PhoE
VPHILLLRHAQASFFGASYDALSELGRRQARALGAHWASVDLSFDRVFVGPLRRHEETYAELRSGYSDRGGELPPAVRLESLDEHHGVQVVAYALGRDTAHAGSMYPSAEDEPVEQERLRRAYFAKFREILLEWSRGHLQVPDTEPFEAFRARAGHVLDELSRAGAGRTLAISSGGLAAMVVGDLLGLTDERVIDLNLLLRNCATTEFLVSASRRNLLSFNALAGEVTRVGETFV